MLACASVREGVRSFAAIGSQTRKRAAGSPALCVVTGKAAAASGARTGIPLHGIDTQKKGPPEMRDFGSFASPINALSGGKISENTRQCRLPPVAVSGPSQY